MRYRVKELREKLGMTQQELADKSGVSRGIIVRLESGLDVATMTSTLIKLADALECEVSDVFTT